MHEAFVSKIQELRAKREEAEKQKQLEDQQENFMKGLI